MQKIDVNWKDLNDLGERTKINVEELTDEINKFMEITDSLVECWKGIDAECYKKATKTYYEKLKDDCNYLENWSILFKKSALKYNGGVEEGLTKVKQNNQNMLKPDMMNEVISNGKQ